jgi:hypothetical protein
MQQPNIWSIWKLLIHRGKIFILKGKYFSSEKKSIEDK